MKKSSAVPIILSGFLLAGCHKHPAYGSSSDWSYGDSTVNTNLTNNTYVQGRGYWHAPYNGWFPFPYNCFRPSWGYYYGGNWHDQPDRPLTASGNYLGGRGFYGGSPSVSSSGSSSDAHSGSVSRGGFGSSAHGSGSSSGS